MNKFLAVVRREYVQGVRGKGFIISTLLGPLMMFVFMVVPGLLFSLKTGGATRVAVVDETGRLYERVRESVERPDTDDEEVAEREARETAQGVSGRPRVEPGDMEVSYRVEPVALAAGQGGDDVRPALDERIERNELDGYLILPRDIFETRKSRYYGRNLGDLISVGRLERRVSRAVKEERMRADGLDPERVRDFNREVTMTRQKPGQEGEQAAAGSFFLALAVGLFVYIAILRYGQAILSAVVEEKTTRIVEVLFSSVRAFPLMAGKLVGVSLVGLTQYAIWALLVVGIVLFGTGALAAGGVENLPHIPPSLAVYALLYFLLGFYIYATLYAVVGSMVTTEKEGGQLAFPVIMLLMAGIYIAFPVIRSPNSSFSFWVSMIPFFSPITMLVRIATETPPFWQIALSLGIGVATVVGLVWVAARIYRTGMLMYGKRATLPEVIRWARRAS
ncbi:MAG TPA: ABC transporter permease [Pyrinomonadaceae bacterium]|nr:ABC transporter permease [Pyrinomonadaceae bacterium]